MQFPQPPPKLTPEEQAAAKYQAATAREVPLLSAFQRGLRITDELYQRLEKAMYHPIGGREYNSALSKDCVALSRALSQMGAVHARLLENEAARAEAMSDEDRIKFMVRALKAKPMSIRQAVIAELLAP